ncbi:MAG TPA: FMN-binding negative transcriptional regulator [Vicinamibacterales bacterium]|nr:FMN-binding negative transcriptional regulator [Vicinamibacterales bacterium]
MYLPPSFEESRPEVLRDLMTRHPLATVVTLGADGLDANHLPLLYQAAPAPHGTLVGHVSRANRVWRDARLDVDALAIFHGPQGYITPAWYPSKADTGKVVPTWNYIVVHAYGRLRFLDDPTWLRNHVDALTATHEAAQTAPWSVSDAPSDYIDSLIKGIVGFELTVTRLLGKWKLNQNKTDAERGGLVRAMREQNDADTTTMAELIERAKER